MVRLGVIGHGERISHVIKYPLRQVEPDARVVAIVDPDQEGARSRLAEEDRAGVTFYATVDEMARQAKLDAILVGTRCNLHSPYGVECARYDLPLFLEKPVAINMEQAVALEEAFESSRCPVVVSFPLRVSPLCELTRQYIAAGEIGPAEHITAVNYVPYGMGYFEGRYRNYAITQGLFLQKATHDFDYMMYLMGASITRVAAMASWGRVFGGNKPAGMTCDKCPEAFTCLESPRNRKVNLSGGRTNDHPCVFGEEIGTPETGMNEDSSNALVEFASGAQGVYTQVFYSRRDSAARGAKVSGYHGTLDFDWYTNQLRRIRHHVPFSDTTRGAEGMGHFGGDDALALNFADLIHGRAESKTPVQTGIQSVYACVAAKESSETGRFLPVRQVGQTSV